MFSLAILIGVYSYVVFTLGVFGFIYKPIVLLISIIYLFICIWYFKKTIISFSIFLKHAAYQFKSQSKKKLIKLLKKNNFFYFLLILLVLQSLINLIGVFGPEISYDALWYHLTLPKLYILQHGIFHIPGNLLYYSDMPKLTEMLYTSALVLTNEYFAKLIHFSFGTLTIIAIYKLSRKFFSKNLSLLSAIVFYSCLVVGWESITAYVDLTRTFFEIMTFWGFVNWVESGEKKWIVASGAMMGLAVTTKLIALGSLLIFVFLFAYDAYLKKEKFFVFIKNFMLFCFFSLLISVPWLVFSFINTGNPFYPYFTNSVVDSGRILALPNAFFILKDLYTFFLSLNDPISPIYLIVLPIFIINFNKFSTKARHLLIYTLASIVIWYLALENRGGRFIMPYLPVFSILAVYSIKQFTSKLLYNFLIIVIIFVSIISISYRGFANTKFLPFLIGKETKSDFLDKHLNFSFGDFYDTDGYFKTNLTNKDTVLLYGFSKLYYIDFNFIDSSWVKRGDTFNYIAVQNAPLSDRFNSWKLVYYNQTTRIKLYSLGGKQWVY